MKFTSLIPSLDTRALTLEHKVELQSFLDQFDDFFLTCEGVKGDAEALLTACPPTKNIHDDKIVLGLYDKGILWGLVDLIQNYPETGTWTIGYLLIAPTKQSHGLGRNIIQELSKTLQQTNDLKLRCVVQEQNPRALAFWQKNGFVITGNTKDNEKIIHILEKNL